MYIDCTATLAEDNEIVSLPDYIKEENESDNGDDDDDDTNDDDDDCDKDGPFPEENQHQLDLYNNFYKVCLATSVITKVKTTI